MSPHDPHAGTDHRERGRSDRKKVSVWEWVVSGLSAATVLATLAYLLYDAVGTARTPPAVELRADTVVEVPGGFMVNFVAANHGHATAVTLQVEAELQDPSGRAVQSARATLDYLPGGATRRGGLLFTRDPREYTLRLRALGFENP